MSSSSSDSEFPPPPVTVLHIPSLKSNCSKAINNFSRKYDALFALVESSLDYSIPSEPKERELRLKKYMSDHQKILLQQSIAQTAYTSLLERINAIEVKANNTLLPIESRQSLNSYLSEKKDHIQSFKDGYSELNDEVEERITSLKNFSDRCAAADQEDREKEQQARSQKNATPPPFQNDSLFQYESPSRARSQSPPISNIPRLSLREREFPKQDSASLPLPSKISQQGTSPSLPSNCDPGTAHSFFRGIPKLSQDARNYASHPLHSEDSQDEAIRRQGFSSYIQDGRAQQQIPATLQNFPQNHSNSPQNHTHSRDPISSFQTSQPASNTHLEDDDRNVRTVINTLKSLGIMPSSHDETSPDLCNGFTRPRTELNGRSFPPNNKPYVDSSSTAIPSRVRDTQFSMPTSAFRNSVLPYQDLPRSRTPPPPPTRSTNIPKQVSFHTNSMFPSVDSSPFSQQTKSRLPEIQLCTFDGNAKDWRNFKATFEVVVHNRDICDIEKMIHLRQVLKGDALDSISMYDHDDYNIAWQHINKLYGNRPFLTDKLVKELESIPKAGYSPSDQRHTLNLLRGLTSMLPQCDQSSNPVLHSLIIQRFSHKVLEDVIEKKVLDPTSDKWTIQKLFNIIDQSILLIERKHEAIGPSYSSSVNLVQFNNRSSPGRSPSPRPPPCVFCRSSNHKSQDCHRVSTVEKRRQFLESNRLCYNCRSSTHLASSCRKPPCPVCDQHHDISICPKYLAWNREKYPSRSPTPSKSTPNQNNFRNNSRTRTPSRDRNYSSYTSAPSSVSNNNQGNRGRSRERRSSRTNPPFPSSRSGSKSTQ